MIVTMACDKDLATGPASRSPQDGNTEQKMFTKRTLESWVVQSVAFARALPPKEKK